MPGSLIRRVVSAKPEGSAAPRLSEFGPRMGQTTSGRKYDARPCEKAGRAQFERAQFERAQFERAQ